MVVFEIFFFFDLFIFSGLKLEISDNEQEKQSVSRIIYVHVEGLKT